MHGHGTFLVDLALVLCVAAPVGLLFRALRMPAILGYLLAGLVVGPYTPIPLFADPERVAALSEFGVVLVMFSVGLEFSIGRFVEVLPRSGLTALLQKRVRELVRGQRPLFETRERNFIKIASEELRRGLIELVPDEDQIDPTSAF